MQVDRRRYNYLHPIYVIFKYFSKLETRKSSGSVSQEHLFIYLLHV